MPRKAEIDRPVRLDTTLPTSVYAKLALHLHSELEGKIPRGAWQRFIMERIQEFFGSKRLDLAPYGMPQGFEVYGSPEAIEVLQRFLSQQVVK